MVSVSIPEIQFEGENEPRFGLKRIWPIREASIAWPTDMFSRMPKLRFWPTLSIGLSKTTAIFFLFPSRNEPARQWALRAYSSLTAFPQHIDRGV